ncbi:TonB-dependent receptor domain-containing protein [Hephaestia mangrovi]|uniref:TonB-dependent receptor domain-containing protein n=1 Tax=Hephaestia mangrovi TaxID=2873268 RepID=UPI001CA741E0|nr:TonB-dependent receptor [Hephaestia mangrovi]
MGTPAEAARAIRFDIEPQSLAAALDQFAREAGVQILYPYAIATTHRVAGLHGTMQPRAALEQLLQGSGLAIASFDDRTIALRVAAPAPQRRRRVGRSEARPAPPPASSPAPEILVTGRAADAALSAAEESYAVTQISAATLADRAPMSTADLFKEIPGFWVESTGGEASNNVRSRGIPTDGYSSVALLEDGLPVQYDGGLAYLNTDQVLRLDATIDRVEAVRGGPSAIFAPNAPGGSINFLTRDALTDPGVTLTTQLTRNDYRRVDGFFGAGIAPHIGVSLGGFYRYDNGLRDPGYPADRGGQLRAAIDYDDGRNRLAFNVKRLDDRVILYLPVPLQFSADGKVEAIPGFDPLTDTLDGPDNVHVPFKTADGTRDFDLSRGTDSRVTFYTMMGRLALGDSAALEVKSRLRTGKTVRNGLFPIGRPAAGTDYIASVWPRLATAYPTAATAEIRYADSGKPFLPSSNGNGLVVGANLLSVQLPMDEFITDTRVTDSVDRWGRHDIAVGLTYDDTRLGYDRQMSTVLLDVSGRAQRLDVVALGAAGQPVGALTDNGFIRYGSLFDDVHIHSSNVAVYLADEWHVGSRWRIDLGARWERIAIRGAAEGSTAVDLGDTATLADDAVLTGDGVEEPIRRRYAGFNWTIGVNYHPAAGTGLFARFTRATRLPGATDFNAAPDRTDAADVPITMAEVGTTFERRHWSLSAVLFGTRFERLPFTDYRFDAVTNSYVERTSIANTSTIGLEFDGHADLFGPLQLDLKATLQNPRYRNFVYVDLADGQAVTHDATGNQLIRVPRLSLRATPSLHLLNDRLRIGADFVHYSHRFADVANSQRLPAYSLINLDMEAQLDRHIKLSVHATNITNVLGLTEGNPRVGSFDAGGSTGYFLARPEFGRTVRVILNVNF